MSFFIYYIPLLFILCLSCTVIMDTHPRSPTRDQLALQAELIIRDNTNSTIAYQPFHQYSLNNVIERDPNVSDPLQHLRSGYRCSLQESDPERLHRDQKMFNSSNVNGWLQENVHYPIIDHFLLITTKADLLAYPRPKDIKHYRYEAALVLKAWRESDQLLMQKYNRKVSSTRNATATIEDGELQTLSIETNSGNILVRAVQPNLLLVLVGDKSNTDESLQVRFIPEAKGEARYPSATPAVIDFSSSDWQEEAEASVQTTDEREQTSTTQDEGFEVNQTAESMGAATEHPQRASPAEPTTLAGVPQFEHGVPGVEAFMESSFSQEELDLGVLHLQRSKLDSMANWLAKHLAASEFLMNEVH